MKGTHIGEFEEIILLIVGILGRDVYGVLIVDKLKELADRSNTIGAVYASLNRLEEKGYLTSQLSGATKERGGRRKGIFEMTALGKNALEASRDLCVSLGNRYVLNTI